MNKRSREGRRWFRVLALGVGVFLYLVWSGFAYATSTWNAPQSFTIAPARGTGSTHTYKHVVFGDSIFAGLTRAYGCGFAGLTPCHQKRPASVVESEYLADLWKADIEYRSFGIDGALAEQVYRESVVANGAELSSENTRVVSFEMCGNDYLKARVRYRNSGSCDTSDLENASKTCLNYVEKSMDYINQNTAPGVHKFVMNLYYPGVNTDQGLTNCERNGTDFKVFLAHMAKSNWGVCNLASKKGFKCIDAFADLNGWHYDSKGNGLPDSEVLAYTASQSLEDYMKRITQTYVGLVHDPDTNYRDRKTAFDYILSDGTHPTYSETVRFTPGDQFGHTQIGLTWSRFNQDLGSPRWLASASTSVKSQPTFVPLFTPSTEAKFTRTEANEGALQLSKPGTQKIRRGFVVPDSTRLPEGYSRLYQSTDTGRVLPPVLVFHPDFKPLDEVGNFAKLPTDRVVTQDWVPTQIQSQLLNPDELDFSFPYSLER